MCNTIFIIMNRYPNNFIYYWLKLIIIYNCFYNRYNYNIKQNYKYEP